MGAKARRVREPIQVYLTRGERTALETLAKKHGVSRAEVLRRGLKALARDDSRSFYDAMDKLVGIVKRGPRDLAERHDEYLARDILARRVPLRRRSS
jgi:hypothetical protein